MKNSPYLNACINESMRLSPSVATDLLRRTPAEGLIIDSHKVPGDTIVSISAYASHRDPKIFSNLEAFWPETWLGESCDRLSDMAAAFIPSSTGPRACIGRNLAILQQVTFIATLCYRYEFAFPSRE